MKVGIATEEGGIIAPRLEIEYGLCCRWLLRAAWLAQELVTTFEKKLGEVALVPGTNAIFEVRLEGEMRGIWLSSSWGLPPPGKPPSGANSPPC